MKKAAGLLVMICLLLSGCSGVRGSATAVPYLPLDAAPEQLDPQVAEDAASAVVNDLLFEGLTRVEADGTVAPAAASWSISDDGKTYIFTLFESYWCHKGEKQQRVTAEDFVYGFYRVLQKQTASPFAEQLFCIEGARAFYEGTASSFGARAIDLNTLQITLEQPDDTFLQKLAHSAFFPCKQSFFEQSAGRYGMTAQDVCSNGPFSLTFWGERQLRLVRNDGYHDKTAYDIPGVRLMIGQADPSALGNGTLDALFVTDEQAQRLRKDGYTVLQAQDTVLCLLFNHKQSVLAQRDCRYALFAGLDRTLVKADGFLPPDTVLVGSEPFRKSGQAVYWSVDETTDARALWRAGVQAANAAVTQKMTLLCTVRKKALAEKILQLWQKNLGLYFVLETVADDATLQKRLQSGRYQLALADQTAQDMHAATQLQAFANAAQNVCGYAEQAFAEAMQTATDRAKLLDLEQRLADQCVYIPLEFSPRYLAVSKRLKGLMLRSFAGVSRSPFDLYKATLHL